MAAKVDDYARTVNNLRTKVASLEDNNADLKHAVADKDREISRQKEKNANLEALKGKEEDWNSKILAKDLLIGNLKQNIQELNTEKNRDAQERNVLEAKVYRLEAELANSKEVSAALTYNLQSLEKKAESYKSKLSSL